MSLRLALALALSTSLAAGCYYEDDCVTLQGNQGADPLPGQRNPYSGQCEYFGGGGGGSGTTCGDYGGPAEPQAADQAPIPDWGFCDGFCEGLVEADCLQAEECRGSYIDSCGGACDAAPSFNQCWAITPGGGFSVDGCNTYDAEECARHNECAAVHGLGPAGGVGSFFACINEPGGGAPPGSCVGDALCEIVPPECPDGTTPGIADNCYTGFCIPFDECDVLPACNIQSEAQCVSRADCEPTYEGIDCTCNGEDCTCADWVFESCS